MSGARLSRRRFMKMGAIGAGGLLLACCGTCCGVARLADRFFDVGLTGTRLQSRVPLPREFENPLPIPPVLKPVRRDSDTDYYRVVQMPARVEILPGLRTEIWGYNGMFPGPTIRATSGRKVVVTHQNRLPVPTVVHLHGGKTPPEHDGYPTDLVLPAGQSRIHELEGHSLRAIGHGEYSYEYPNQQPAATLWYHDHRMDFTGPQVYRGLAGFYLITDDQERSLPLPSEDRDIPLMICDRSFDEDGSLMYPSIDPSLMGQPGVVNEYMDGVLGDVILVNGAPWPYMNVSRVRYRFRVLNASNARRYRLVLDPPPPEGYSFTQIGSDVGLLESPVRLHKLEIAPAERYDLIVDFSAYQSGDVITLRNELGNGKTALVMQFRVSGKADEYSQIPSRLSEIERLAASDALVRRRFVFARGVARNSSHTSVTPVAMWTINGQPFDPMRIDADVELGATEIWRITTNVHHPVHLHLAHFQVLSRNGGPPGPYDAGWKDTVDMGQGDTVEVLARFDGYKGKYVFHCHNLEHEDMAMMGNIRVS